MKWTQIISEQARCPYYHKQDPMGIFCDSLIGGFSSKENMASKQDVEEYLKHFCCDKWELCPKAALIQKEKETEARILAAARAAVKEIEKEM